MDLGHLPAARVEAAIAAARGDRTRRTLSVDTLLVGLGVAWALWAIDGDRQLWVLLPPWWMPVDVTVGLIASAALWWRRRHPVLIAVVLAALGGVFLTAGIPALIAVYTVASLRRARVAVLITLGHIAIAIPYFLVVPLGGVGIGFWAVTMVLVYITALTLGLAVRARRLVIAGLVAMNDADRREAELRLLRAREAERARIAREMHDVLAHRLSLLSVHAGALEHRTRAEASAPPSASEVREAAGVIRSSAHVALEELREVLHLLGSGSDGELGTGAPQPTITALDDLVTEAAAAGERVTLAVEGREVLACARRQLQRSVFRTVQEGMTNARKHAPGALVEVEVRAT
ncbi:sensor histidine kinase, partial [Pseudactinotalea sp.]|uniref:sensor histidine kinase n=1 Tax=Pseudactinotalea sp. TaxID=1926260 RepID=UPI003B3A69FF